MLIAVTRRSKKISGAPKMISADDPDALGTRRDTTTLITPGAASQRDPDVSPQNGPPANNDTELAPRLYKIDLPASGMSDVTKLEGRVGASRCQMPCVSC
jgi:hypothetical protein